MKKEQNYDFLKRMQVIHKPDRRDASVQADAGELVLDNGWEIRISPKASCVVRRAAKDMQDYLLTSMKVSVAIVETDHMIRAPKTLLYTTLADYQGKPDRTPEKQGAFVFEGSAAEGILLCGAEERAVLYGSIHLEDEMNLREAPYLKAEKYLREPLTRMRSIHSGCAIDTFPDWQLDAIVHAGFNAIDLFVKGPDTTTRGYCNINDLIDRAASYGLDVVFYSYLKSYKHPDDPDAEAFFDSVYGEIFRRHPKAAAIHLVGESLEFPSKDPHTTGKRYNESVTDGIPDTRPSPGWFPCYDYPAYLKRIADAVHRVKPDAEVIINTYNWGWSPLEIRRKFLEALPEDITLHVTYDIFKQNDHGGLSCPTMDYSISAADPGYYFTSEVETAHEIGIKRIRATTNTAGATWDFGTAPYVPVPFRFLRRMEVLKKYLLSCGLTSFYETHHYGWWPNPCIDMAKEIFASNGETDIPALLQKVAARDYGREAAPKVVETWKIWSDAMDNYVGTNEDQYGPWRVGPAYPFIFQPNISRVMANKEIRFPAAPYAHFGGGIVKTFYMPYENENQSPGPLRYPVEIRMLEKMLLDWDRGLANLEEARKLIPAEKRAEGARLHALGKFIRNSIRTTLNMKHWWLLNMKLQIPSDAKTMLGILDEIEKLAHEEIANVKDTFEPVECDSRIGWEPSMEYVCDAWHLDWKLRQMDHTLREIAIYRKIIQL